MKRILIAVAALLAIAFAGTAIGMRTVGDDPAHWHVDPANTERTGKPNDYLVAPPESTKAQSDRTFQDSPLPPEALLFLFDSVVRPGGQGQPLAGSVDDGHVTYVVRSAVVGFPDYVSVKAVKRPNGSALIIWSRSRFGYSDLGANKERVDRWLAQIDQTGR